MLRYVLVSVLLFSCLINPFAASIKGQLELSEEWAPVIYISAIHSFDDLQTASYDLLRFQIELDSTGAFQVDDLEIPSEDLIYRLHICKKGDPVSTIIIGGQEENFVHFIMNNETEVSIYSKEVISGLSDINIKGAVETELLSTLFQLQQTLNTPLELPSEQNRAFTKNQVLNELTTVADTATNPIIRLLAVYFINEQFANENHIDLMEKIQAGLIEGDTSNPYYASFENRLQFLQFQNNLEETSIFRWLRWLAYVLVIPFILLAIWWRRTNNRSESKSYTDQKVKSLSTQERKVFGLLKKGKSNKEISSELNIEVSTVKSHLHKIYSRLGVKSRKEVVDKDL